MPPFTMKMGSTCYATRAAPMAPLSMENNLKQRFRAFFTMAIVYKLETTSLFSVQQPTHGQSQRLARGFCQLCRHGDKLHKFRVLPSIPSLAGLSLLKRSCQAVQTSQLCAARRQV